MTWARIDDQFHSHPKVLRAWHAHRASLGLHMLALSYAGAWLTDGHVPEAFVRSQIGGATERRRAVGALVDAGLWEPVEQGWRIHDYLEFNETRAAVIERRLAREQARERAGVGGSARTPATPTPTPLSSSGVNKTRRGFARFDQVVER